MGMKILILALYFLGAFLAAEWVAGVALMVDAVWLVFSKGMTR